MAALLAAMAAVASGCLSCQPLLEVRHCLDEQRVCGPEAWSADAIAIEWTPERAARWPDVTALMDATDLGDHAHRKWTAGQQQTFWSEFNVTGDEPELFATYMDDVYRVRVLTCA